MRPASTAIAPPTTTIARAIVPDLPGQGRLHLEQPLGELGLSHGRRLPPMVQVSSIKIRVYQPSTRPGAPLPHAWIDDEDGNRRPVKDLVAPGRFLLIAGEDGQAWCDAARELAAEADLPLDAVRIGHLDGDLYDPRCTWQRHRQITSDGAILVRPDRFIAWRHPAADSEPRAVLAATLSQILARPAGTPTASAA